MEKTEMIKKKCDCCKQETSTMGNQKYCRPCSIFIHKLKLNRSYLKTQLRYCRKQLKELKQEIKNK